MPALLQTKLLFDKLLVQKKNLWVFNRNKEKNIAKSNKRKLQQNPVLKSGKFLENEPKQSTTQPVQYLGVPRWGFIQI